MHTAVYTMLFACLDVHAANRIVSVCVDDMKIADTGCRVGLGASGHSSRGEGGSGSTTASLAAEKALASVASGQSSPTHSPRTSATSPVFSLGMWATLLLGG